MIFFRILDTNVANRAKSDMLRQPPAKTLNFVKKLNDKNPFSFMRDFTVEE